MHAYLDGELQPPTILQYEEHVHQCAACSHTLAEQQQLQAGLKSDEMYYKAPETLRQRLTTSLRKPDSARRHHLAWRWLAPAACLALCVGAGFLLALMVLSPPQHDRLAQEVVAGHIRSLQVERSRLLDVRSSDRHEVKPWFADKLDFSPPVPDLMTKGYVLLGGRLDYVDGKTIAALVYQRRQHLISVFIWPDSGNGATQPRRETRQGFQVISWSRAGMNYWAVSDLNADELEQFAQALN
jgi:anti-sigma factor RsiW